MPRLPKPIRSTLDLEEQKAAYKEAEAATATKKAEAKAIAEKAAARATILKAQKTLCAYLIIFCLHYHECSVASIFSALQSYDLEVTKNDIAWCIKDNKLLTHADALPDDEGEQSVFKIDQTPELIIFKHHTKNFRVKMTHPWLPDVQSRTEVLSLSSGPESRRIVTVASKKQVMFDIFCRDCPYPLAQLVPHFTRCMQRAIGLKFPISDQGLHNRYGDRVC